MLMYIDIPVYVLLCYFKMFISTFNSLKTHFLWQAFQNVENVLYALNLIRRKFSINQVIIFRIYRQ